MVEEKFFPEGEDGSLPKIPKKYAKEHSVRVPGRGTTVYLYDDEKQKDEELIDDEEDDEKGIDVPSLDELMKMSRAELDELAEELGIDPKNYSRKDALADAINEA